MKGRFGSGTRGIVGAGRSGMTLVEIVVSFAVGLILMGAVVAAMLSQADAVDSSVNLLLAQSECDRATLVFLEDLQTTNTVEKDGLGNPYFKVVDDGSGIRAEFRRVEGFDADEAADVVRPIYGTVIRYILTADHQLIRKQGAAERVIANRVSKCDFSLSAEGTIQVHIETYAGTGSEKTTVENTISVTPRNGYDR